MTIAAVIIVVVSVAFYNCRGLRCLRLGGKERRRGGSAPCKDGSGSAAGRDSGANSRSLSVRVVGRHSRGPSASTSDTGADTPEPAASTRSPRRRRLHG